MNAPTTREQALQVLAAFANAAQLGHPAPQPIVQLLPAALDIAATPPAPSGLDELDRWLSEDQRWITLASGRRASSFRTTAEAVAWILEQREAET